MNPLSSMKQHLSTIPASGMRYRLVKNIWWRKGMRETKACTFYWVMLPTSAIGFIFYGIFFLIGMAILAVFIVVGWLFGYTCGVVDDRGTHLHGDPMYYPYRYHPRSGKSGRLAPWMIWAPGLVFYLIFGTGIAQTATSAGSNTVSFAVDKRYVGLAVVLGLALFGAIGYGATKLLMGRELHPALRIKRRWEEICPVLTVDVPPTEKQLVEA